MAFGPTRDRRFRDHPHSRPPGYGGIDNNGRRRWFGGSCAIVRNECHIFVGTPCALSTLDLISDAEVIELGSQVRQ